MADILQTFSNAIFLNKKYCTCILNQISLKFDPTDNKPGLNSIDSRNGLALNRQQAITRIHYQVLWHYMALPAANELNQISMDHCKKRRNSSASLYQSINMKYSNSEFRGLTISMCFLCSQNWGKFLFQTTLVAKSNNSIGRESTETSIESTGNYVASCLNNQHKHI